MPFLKRFEEIPAVQVSEPIKDDNVQAAGCTNTFLKFTQLPDDESYDIDLRQTAVLSMAHLDRLAAPYIPPQSFNKVKCFTLIRYKNVKI